MTEFTKEQLQHIIVLNADRLFDTRAQPGWKREKLVEAIIEKAQMIIETPDSSLSDYRMVGETILNYVLDIESANNPAFIVDATGDMVDHPCVIVYDDVPTHTIGLIEKNEETGKWEAVRGENESEEDFNQRRAEFHKAERARKRVDVEPAATPQQHLSRVFGVNEK